MYLEERERAIGALKIGAFFGAVKNITNTEYHSMHEYWSSSDLKFMIENSPAHFQHEYFPERKPKKNTESKILGSLVHSHLLSPQDFDKEFAKMPAFPTKEECGISIKDQKAKWFEQNKDKTEYTDELLEKSLLMAESVRRNEEAMTLLNSGEKELSIFWTCPFSKLKFRAKCDVGGPRHLVELKTAISGHPLEFSKQIVNLHYDLSIIHYGEALRSKFKIAPPASFIVVESEPPFVTSVYPVGATVLETGHRDWMSAVTQLRDGLVNKKWPGYQLPNGEKAIEVPKWAMVREDG